MAQETRQDSLNPETSATDKPATADASPQREEGRRERAERGEGRRERGERGEGRRERTPRSERPGREAAPAELAVESVTDVALAPQSTEGTDAVAEGERRERRSRDRYGRERRGDRPGREQQAADAGTGSTHEVASQPSTEPASVTAPATATTQRAPMPVIQSYQLPVESLVSVAQSAQLEWVQSDPARVAQVQAAIAAEPKPIHVPRERPPMVVVDEGPLILVETRKDLSQMKMPFES